MRKGRKWTAIIEDERRVRLVLENGEVEVEIPYQASPPLERVCKDAAFLQEVYDSGRYTAKTLGANLELVRLDDAGKWLFRVEGLVSYEVELTQEEALLMALTARKFESEGYIARCPIVELFLTLELNLLDRSIGVEAAAEILRDRLSRAAVKGPSAYGFIEPREDGFHLFVEDPGYNIWLRAAKLMSEEAGAGVRMRLSDEEAIKILFGVTSIEEIEHDKEFAIRLHKLIVPKLLRPLLASKRIEFEEDGIVVKNCGITWEVDLVDGGLRVDGEYVCTTFPFIVDDYGFIYIPGLGTVELTRNTARLLCNLMYALMPERIRDPDLCRRILAKTSPLGELAELLPIPCFFLQLWLKLRRWLRPL